MAFVKVVNAGAVKTGIFKISTAQMRKNGPFRFVVAMPHADHLKYFGKAERADVAFGDGPDKGKMLITGAADGAFKFIFMKFTVLLRLPELDFTPQAKFEGADPERKITDDGLVVALPGWVERWKDILAARETAIKQTRAETLQRLGTFKP